LMMASTSTWMGFWSDSRWMMSNAWLTMRTWGDASVSGERATI
jgi:hypothetical protein